MMKVLLGWISFAVLVATLQFGSVAYAQEETAHHRKIYAAINAAQTKMRQVNATYRDEPVEFALTGWFEGNELKKIVARSNGDGDGVTEYYLEGQQPLFVFNTYHLGSVSQKGAKVEERLYFQDGAIFRWLTTEKPTPVLHSEDYQATTELYETNCKAFVEALNKAKSGKAGKGAAAKTQQQEGVFIGIEEGDYFHWQLRTAQGEEVSYFILQPDASVDQVVEDPGSYLGRRCVITWQKSMEDIPEAGGKMEIEQIMSVKWLTK